MAESEVQRQHEQALTQPDPVRRLQMAAHWHRRQMELGCDVIAIYTKAAQADEVIARDWRQIEAGRERANTTLIASLDGYLVAGLTQKTAVDLYLAATVAEVHSLLVLQQDWSLAQYESWLREQLRRQLLLAGEPAPSVRSGSSYILRSPRASPPNALTPAEREQVLAVLRAPQHSDPAVAQVWALELHEGRYYITMYRVMRATGEVNERRSQATHPANFLSLPKDPERPCRCAA